MGKQRYQQTLFLLNRNGAKLLAPDQVHIDLVNKLSKACDLDDMFAMLRTGCHRQS